jgi:hypothetical protein
MQKQLVFPVVVLPIILIWFMFFVPNSGFTQTDIIYKKAGGEFPCRVREITIDLIRYERVDVKNGPIIEIKKQDVYKIQYKNGVA